jgi:hypothetical protein
MRIPQPNCKERKAKVLDGIYATRATACSMMLCSWIKAHIFYLLFDPVLSSCVSLTVTYTAIHLHKYCEPFNSGDW